jgi:hypothetical protein
LENGTNTKTKHKQSALTTKVKATPQSKLSALKSAEKE